MEFLKKVPLILFIVFLIFACYNYTLENKRVYEVYSVSEEVEQGSDILPNRLLPEVIEQEDGLAMDWKPIKRKNSFNEELQYYTPENVVIEEEAIRLVAKREALEDRAYTSALVKSREAYLYGYFEFVVTPPKGTGLFPAIWLLPLEDKSLPEIDIFEMIGSEPYEFSGVIHFEEGGKQKRDFFTYTVPPKEKYKVALKWTPEKLSWYIDDQVVFETSLGVPQEHMYILMNLAVGGKWPGPPNEETIFPSTFCIEGINLEPQHSKLRE
ncbi:MAG: glycoside hydrolase family 16 protein [Niameybacter sp.]|uniref:glycoside hydrolase family 16 protein n=1 Tax=Niameybacter sp. TaxID=2033640 RepID=UPI002FC9C4F7